MNEQKTDTNRQLSDDFKGALSRFASGVTIVTCLGENGEPFGFTASSFSSLSLDPPLVLVCFDRKAESFPVFQKAEHFGVSILSEDQTELAIKFSIRGADKFSGSAVEAGPAAGAPLVQGAMAHLECRMHEQLNGGDHVIFVGEVLRARSNDQHPLIYFNRRFGKFAPAE